MGLGAALWRELISGLPGSAEMATISVRLLVAIGLGCVLGFQRAHVGKAAGKMLVALALLASSPLGFAAAVP
jgi:hypothetical protein